MKPYVHERAPKGQAYCPPAVCDVCGLELPNPRSPRMRVHPGACFIERGRAISRRTNARARQSQPGHYLRGQQRYDASASLVEVRTYRLSGLRLDANGLPLPVEEWHGNNDETRDPVEE